MARIDDYKESFRLASLELRAANLERLAQIQGVDLRSTDNGNREIRIVFLATPYLVRVGEEVDVLKEDQQSGEVSLPEKILICHYLLRASQNSPSGQLITFRQIPDGHFYFDAFQRRARDPFLATFGQRADLFRRCAERLGGKPVDTGDVGMAFEVLPGLVIQVALWQGDEELPPEASILFDTAIQRQLPVEDVAVVSGMLVYRLMGISRSLSS